MATSASGGSSGGIIGDGGRRRRRVVAVATETAVAAATGKRQRGRGSGSAVELRPAAPPSDFKNGYMYTVSQRENFGSAVMFGPREFKKKRHQIGKADDGTEVHLVRAQATDADEEEMIECWYVEAQGDSAGCLRLGYMRRYNVLVDSERQPSPQTKRPRRRRPSPSCVNAPDALAAITNFAANPKA